MTDVLRSIGLSENEVTLFKALCEHGTSKATSLVKKTGVSPSRAYQCLDRLVEEGLLTCFKDNNVQHYTAKPEALVQREEQRLEDVKALSERLAASQPSTDEPVLELYTDTTGFRTALKTIIGESEDSTLRIYGFPDGALQHELLRVFLQNINAKMQEKEIETKLIVPQGATKQHEDRGEEPHIAVREDKEAYNAAFAYDITPDAVYLLTWEDQPRCVRIQEDTVVRWFTEQFGTKWDNLEAQA